MANFADVNTGRFLVTYQNGGQKHTHKWRFERPQGAAPTGGQLAAISAVYDAMGSRARSDYRILSAVWISPDQRVSTPATAPTISVNTAILPAPTKVSESFYIRFEGRSVEGSRFNLSLMGATLGGGEGFYGNYRINAGEDAVLGNFIEAIEGVTGLVAIDGNPLLWYQYANCGVNRYWMRQAR